MFKFIATIYKEGMNYVVKLPGESMEYFKKKEYIPVRGTIDGKSFKGTLIPRKNERHALFINSEIRSMTGKSVSDEIQVNIEYDPETRELTVPEDMELLLSADTRIYKAFIELSAAQRREIIRYIKDAKRTATRLSRIRKLEEFLQHRIKKKSGQ